LGVTVITLADLPLPRAFHVLAGILVRLRHRDRHVSYDTLYFALFLAATWTAFRLLPHGAWILLAASVVFYAVAGLRDTVIATLLILTNYGFQFAVMRDRRWLWAVLTLNFGCLAYFKYRVFLAGAAGMDGFGHEIVIPLGISFYVFQLSAFLVDIRRGRAQPFRSLPRFALFKLFFGQLVAGPIMRWKQFGPQINRLFDHGPRRHRLLGLGLGLCLLGLFKKVVLADSLAPVVDLVFDRGPADAATAWLGAWLFGFQIYFDFSAYSEMALGIAYLFGLKLAINFRQPYLTRTPQAFWQHWHITLSQWIRDYLYIPLGGGRGGVMRQFAVLLLVMALAGLWHGPNWTFVVWGLGWAVITALWRFRSEAFALLGIGEWLLMLVLTMLLWTVFRAADLPSAVRFLGTMFGAGPSGDAAMMRGGWTDLMMLSGCLFLLALQAGERALFTRRAALAMRRLDGVFLRAFFIGLSLLLLMMPKLNDNPFIYFRF
jgi:alginate O-acetyltransferase complex protein AlgI